VLGGHDVPEAVVRRRWAAGLRSLVDLYLPIVDRWVVSDSSDSQLRELAEGSRGCSMLRILDEERWNRFLRLAAGAGASAAGPGGEFFDPVAPVHDDGES
jgi:predicted ABC-type ATPase